MHKTSTDAAPPPRGGRRKMSFFNVMAILGVLVFTPHAEASAIALAADGGGSGSVSRGVGEAAPLRRGRDAVLEVVVGPREASTLAPAADEDAAMGLSGGQRAAEDMVEDARNEWEAEDGWGWMPPQQPRKRSGDAIVKRMSPQERMVKMLEFDFAPLVEDFLLTNAHRLAAAAAAAPDAEGPSAASAPTDTQNANLDLEQVVQKVLKATEKSAVASAAPAEAAAAGAAGAAGASPKTSEREATARVTADVVRHLLRRADIAPNVSASEVAAATSPAPTPFGEVIRKVARVTADLMRKMQKRKAQRGGKRHAQSEDDTRKTSPSAATNATAMEEEGNTTEDKDFVATCAPATNYKKKMKKRGELPEAKADTLATISQRRDVEANAQKRNESAQKNASPPDPSQAIESKNSTVVTRDTLKAAPGGMDWSASLLQPGEVKLIEIEEDVEGKRPERMTEVLEMENAMNVLDPDPDRYVFESPFMKEASIDVNRNKRKLDGNLLEESWRDMGGDIIDRSSAMQENRMNLMERNAVFPTIEETLKDLVERAIEENLFSGQGSFLPDVETKENGKDQVLSPESKSEKRKADLTIKDALISAHGQGFAKGIDGDKKDGAAKTVGASNKTGVAPVEIKGAYWRVTDKDNAATRAVDAFKSKRQARQKASDDASSDQLQKDRGTIKRDIEALASSIMEGTSSEDVDVPLTDGTEKRAGESTEALVSDQETEITKKDEVKRDSEKEHTESSGEIKLGDSTPVGIEKSETSEEESVTTDIKGDVTNSINSSGNLLTSTTDQDATGDSQEKGEEDGSPVPTTEADDDDDDDDAGSPIPTTALDGSGGGGGGGGGGSGGGGGDETTSDSDSSTDTHQTHDPLDIYAALGRTGPATGLSCYQCRSDEDHDCGTSLPNKKYLKPCEFDEPPKRAVCRLVKREIDTVQGKKDLVMRTCGSDSASPDGGCYESLWGQQTTCECLATACNGAVSALLRAASVSASHKTFMLGEERAQQQSSGTNMVPLSLIYAVLPLATFLPSRPGLFQY